MTSLNKIPVPELAVSGNVGLEIADEYLNLFRTASNERLIINLKTIAEAETLRFKLHHIRKQMRRHAHPLLAIAERVTFKVQGSTLLAQPSTDAKYRDVLGKALATARKGTGRQDKKEKRNANASKTTP